MTFDKGESKFEKKNVCVCVCGGGEGTQYRNTQFRACGKLNISKYKSSNFELSTKFILIKNLSLIKTVFKFNFLFFLFYFILFNILYLFLLFLFFFFLNFIFSFILF